jgi:hypothetical protein
MPESRLQQVAPGRAGVRQCHHSAGPNQGKQTSLLTHFQKTAGTKKQGTPLIAPGWQRVPSPPARSCKHLSASVAVEDPIVTVLARERLRRWDRFRISVDLIVAVAEPMDPLGLEVMHFPGARSGLDPTGDWRAIRQLIVRERQLRRGHRAALGQVVGTFR